MDGGATLEAEDQDLWATASGLPSDDEAQDAASQMQLGGGAGAGRGNGKGKGKGRGKGKNKDTGKDDKLKEHEGAGGSDPGGPEKEKKGGSVETKQMQGLQQAAARVGLPPQQRFLLC